MICDQFLDIYGKKNVDIDIDILIISRNRNKKTTRISKIANSDLSEKHLPK